MDLYFISLVFFDSNPKTRKSNYKKFIKFLNKIAKSHPSHSNYCNLLTEHLDPSNPHMDLEREDFKLKPEWDDFVENILWNYFDDHQNYDTFMFDYIAINNDGNATDPILRSTSNLPLISLNPPTISGYNLNTTENN
jgi:hypothetical protein